MAEGKTLVNLTPGWVRKVVKTGVENAILTLRANYFYSNYISNKTGTGAPTFPDGVKTNTISEATASAGITAANLLILSKNARYSVQTVAAASATIDATKYFVAVTYTTTGAVTLTLPAASTVIGIPLTVADCGANAATNNITINRAGTDTIIADAVGQTSATINGDGDVLRFLAINATTFKVW